MRPIIPVKTLEHFQGPLNYATFGSAAIDLRMPIKASLAPGAELLVKTGLCLDMSKSRDIAALIIPRSGLGSRGLEIKNTVGLIDSDYQGEIMVRIFNSITIRKNQCLTNDHYFDFERGDRFCQMFFTPIIHPILQDVETFDSETERGDGGFGSTGSS